MTLQIWAQLTDGRNLEHRISPQVGFSSYGLLNGHDRVKGAPERGRIWPVALPIINRGANPARVPQPNRYALPHWSQRDCGQQHAA